MIEAFHQMVLAIYAAASAESNWSAALEAIAHQFDAWGVELIGVDNRSRAVVFSLCARMPAEAHLSYLQSFHRIDPRADVGRRMPEGQWISCHELFDEDFVANDPYYQQHLIPHGGRWFTGSRLIDGPDVSVLFGVHRGLEQKPLDDAERQLLEQLGQHVAQAYRLDDSRQDSTLRAAVGEALLDRLPSCVLLTDAAGEVMHSNRPAHLMLESEPDWLDAQRRVQLPDPASQSRWTELLESLSRPMPGMAQADRRHTVLLQHKGRAVTLWASALWPKATRGVFGSEPRALLMWPRADPLHAQQHAVEMASHFALTPAQARLAGLLLQGHTVQRAATELGVSVTTVRTHLQQLMLKTQTRRQADLVMALARGAALPLPPASD